MFFGLDIEILLMIEKRLKAELKNRSIPHHRKEEIESCLYRIDKAKQVKEGFYADKKGV